MRAARNLSLAWLLLVVSACALLPQPQTIEEAVFVQVATIRALREQTAERQAAGLITDQEALAISAKLDEARKYTDLATTALELGKPTDAESALDTAIAILDKLEGRRP